jgi:hypothetical protein
MKCLICGAKTNKKILCNKHMRETDSFALSLTNHTCGSFFQRKNDVIGICQNNLLCEPIKRALKGETLIAPNSGHVVCPYPTINLIKIVYRDLEENEIKQNYPECLD